MSVDTPRTIVEIGDQDVRVGKPVSFLRLGNPIVKQADWLLGCAMGGPRIYSVCEGISTGASPTYRAMIHRHPNCDHLDVAMLVRYQITQVTPTVVITAGTGAATTLTLSVPDDYYGWHSLRMPWGAADSGVLEVVIACTDVSLAAIMAYDVPRPTLGAGDDRIEHQDQDGPHAGSGIVEGWWLTASQTAGARAMIQEVVGAWDDLKPTIFSWPGDTADALAVAAGAGWTDPFGGATFEGIARRKRATETRRAVDWWAYVKTLAGGTFFLRMTSANPGPGADSTITTGVVSSAAWGWVPIAGVMVDCTTDAHFTLEMDATNQNCYIAALFGVEQ